MNVVYSFRSSSTFLAAPKTSSPEQENIASNSSSPFFVFREETLHGNGTSLKGVAAALPQLAALHQDLISFSHSIFDRHGLSEKSTAGHLELDDENSTPVSQAELLTCALSTLPLFRVVVAEDGTTDSSQAGARCYFLYEYLQSRHFTSPSAEPQQFSSFFTTWDSFLVAVHAAAFDCGSAGGTANLPLSLKQYIENIGEKEKHKTSKAQLSVQIWDEEMLWRLLSALVSVLSVYHAAGFYFEGRFDANDILAFCLPSGLAEQLENAQTAFTTNDDGARSYSDKMNPGAWDERAIGKFVQSITTDVLLPRLLVNADSPVHRTFFVLTALPSNIHDPNNHKPPEAVAECQARDIRRAGRLLTDAIEACGDAASSTISSELSFLVRRMTDDERTENGFSSTRPNALVLARLQALKLRRYWWYYRLMAEENMHLAQRCDKRWQRRWESLSFADGVRTEKEAPALDLREKALEEREKKLDAILELYELTHSRLDALPSTTNIGYSELHSQLSGSLGAGPLPEHKSTAVTVHPRVLDSRPSSSPPRTRATVDEKETVAELSPDQKTPERSLLTHISHEPFYTSSMGSAVKEVAAMTSTAPVQPHPFASLANQPLETADAKDSTPYQPPKQLSAARWLGDFSHESDEETVTSSSRAHRSAGAHQRSVQHTEQSGSASSSPEPHRVHEEACHTPSKPRDELSRTNVAVTTATPDNFLSYEAWRVRDAATTSPLTAQRRGTAPQDEVADHADSVEPISPLPPPHLSGQQRQQLSGYSADEHSIRRSKRAVEETTPCDKSDRPAKASSPASVAVQRSPRAHKTDDRWIQHQYSVLEELRTNFQHTATKAATTGATRSRSRSSVGDSMTSTPQKECTMRTTTPSVDERRATRHASVNKNVAWWERSRTPPTTHAATTTTTTTTATPMAARVTSGAHSARLRRSSATAYSEATRPAATPKTARAAIPADRRSPNARTRNSDRQRNATSAEKAWMEKRRPRASPADSSSTATAAAAKTPNRQVRAAHGAHTRTTAGGNVAHSRQPAASPRSSSLSTSPSLGRAVSSTSAREGRGTRVDGDTTRAGAGASARRPQPLSRGSSASARLSVAAATTGSVTASTYVPFFSSLDASRHPARQPDETSPRRAAVASSSATAAGERQSATALDLLKRLRNSAVLSS